MGKQFDWHCMSNITTFSPLCVIKLSFKISLPLQVACNLTSDNILTLTNGLITRAFTVKNPGFGTIDYRSEVKSRSILRTLFPEGYVTLDGTQYPVGGVTVTTHHSFLNRSSINTTILPKSFQFSGYELQKPVAPFHWEPGLRHAPADVSWPPEGLTLVVTFTPPVEVALPAHADIRVQVKYEMYQGVPILAKWLTVENLGGTPVRVDGATVEYLGTQKPYAPLDLMSVQPGPWSHDYSAVTTSWLYVEADIPYGPQLSWTTDPMLPQSPGADEPLLNASYKLGPGVWLQLVPDGQAGQNLAVPSFATFRLLELVTDSNDEERVAMSRHRMTRLLAPQTQENPIFFHCTNTTEAGFKEAVDQMEQVGFEMFIYSFGSGFHLEDISKENIDEVAANVAYAKAKGIEVGG